MRVAFSPEALDDLLSIEDFIADQASETVAADYTRRIETRCRSLADMPESGTRRLLYGGRDITAALESD